MTVRIVTDSTCDLPADEVERYGITVVPLSVFFGDEGLLDGIDITAADFYGRMTAFKGLPRTSQPSVELFQDAYLSLAGDGVEIVSIHVSSKLSGTLNAASVAREVVKNEVHVDLIDSYNVSLGLGLIVLEAARAAQAGATVPEVVATARRAMDRVSVHVVVDTLEYLQKGGRIGRARSFLGSVLSIKPIIRVEDGEIAPFERVRTRSKAVERMFEVASNMPRAKEMFVGCSGGDTDALALIERLRPLLPHTDLKIGYLGPVVGVYTGPNALGIAALERE
ncbi:MAG: DegV family protein [Chloroflexi bacterium]|nr:DegV family protein [Chloroflexota bacterium]PWB42156.1 MAG: DegV family protein [Dehalococcoidia bacterium]